MPSPFPGMDPWLEDRNLFPDVHAGLTTRLQEAVNAALPVGYFAATETITWVDVSQRTVPDVTLIGPPRRPAGGVVAVLDYPTSMHALGVKPRPLDWEQPYLEIRTAGGDRVVTAIELVSRANKAAGEGRRAYLDKQDEFSLGGVSVVEIDLLRYGTHVTAVPLPRLQHLAGDTVCFHVCVTLARRPEQLFGVAFGPRQPLPAIDIPLDPGVPPVRIELQPLLDRAYDAGRFHMRAKYAAPPDPPLSADDQAWAEGILRVTSVTPETA
jgi:hypothetical protein